MRFNQVLTGVFIVAFAGGGVLGDIVRIDEFSSLQFESFENASINFEYGQAEVFNGIATVFNTGGSWIHAASSDIYIMTLQPYEGQMQMGAMEGAIAYQFDSPQKSFGGYFSAVGSVADGIASFYSGGTLIDTQALYASADSAWTWNGWTSDQSFDRVVIESNLSTKGYLVHDAIRVLSVEVPSPGSSVLAIGSAMVLLRRRRA